MINALIKYAQSATQDYRGDYWGPVHNIAWAFHFSGAHFNYKP